MTEKNGVSTIIWPEQLAKALAFNLGKIEVEFSDKQIAELLADKVLEMTGGFDDAGCEWTTTKKGHFCIAGEPEWLISKKKHVGILVDAINILRYGMVLKVEQQIKVKK